MSLFDELVNRRNEIIAIGAKNGVVNIRIFGSVAREENDDKSDIDILVSMQPGRSYFDLVGFQQEMAKIFPQKIDVISDKGISRFIKDRILNEARPL